MYSDFRATESVFKNINSITVEVISEIEKQLTCSDISSLVFLLYDGPDTALERLTLLQRLTIDGEGSSLNLLHDWSVKNHSQAKWRYIFLEALATCQLYAIVRKLSFDVAAVKNYFDPDNLNVTININPMKKVLYKLCESMDGESFLALKKAFLINHDVNMAGYDSGELVFLNLMKEKIISLHDIEKLIKIIEDIPALKNFVHQLKITEETIKTTNKTNTEPSGSQTESVKRNDTVKKVIESSDDINIDELLTYALEDNSVNLKSDQNLFQDCYKIKNADRVGVAYIINQEKFSSNKQNVNCSTPLEDRHGSKKDTKSLEKVLSAYNFKVITDENLTIETMLHNITKIIKNEVITEDSIFILCLLSHGRKGEVFAACGKPVKLEEIQALLDDSIAGKKLWGMPKVLIIQACQVMDNKPPLQFVADGPRPIENIGLKQKGFLRKSDYLVFWAAAPEYEAFRNVKFGSIFIQTLCSYLQSKGKIDQISDIFTMVLRHVKKFCEKHDKAQLPIIYTTLEKKLYLCIPK